MKKLLVVIPVLLVFAGANSQCRDYAYKPVPFTSVKLSDDFWLPLPGPTGIREN